VGVLPFRLEGGIVVDVSVNGAAPAPFLFDTGATMTSLDASFAAGLGLHPSGGGKALGPAGGIEAFDLVKGVALRAGDVSLPRQDVAVMALPNRMLDRGRRPRLAGVSAAWYICTNHSCGSGIYRAVT
jgi:predicted aspartyl protease